MSASQHDPIDEHPTMDAIIATNSHKYTRYSPTSPSYSPTSPNYETAGMESMKQKCMDALGKFAKCKDDEHLLILNCSVCHNPFESELDYIGVQNSTAVREPVVVCDSGHMVCRPCSRRIAPRPGKCPLYGCDATNPKTAAAENMTLTTIDHNRMFEMLDVVSSAFKDFKDCVEKEDVKTQKLIMQQQDKIESMKLDKRTLYGEYTLEHGRVGRLQDEINRMATSHHEEMEKMKDKLDEAVSTLGDTIRRTKRKYSDAVEENKKLKAQLHPSFCSSPVT